MKTEIQMLPEVDVVDLDNGFRALLVERRAEAVEVGDRRAIVPEVRGQAFVTGRAEYWLDPDDPLGEGFLIR